MYYKRGLTLLEIIISLVILSMMMLGMLSVFLSAKRQGIHSRTRISSVELGKLWLDPLQIQVRQNESSPGLQNGWNESNNGLRVRINDCSAGTITLNNIVYTPCYNVSTVGSTDLRRVTVRITWNE